MIEFPEAATIARQMGVELSGRRVTYCLRGNSPHKFAFYSYSPEGYSQVMTGAQLGDSRVDGKHILIRVGSEHTLVLGDGGEKILLHTSQASLPKKHQLLLGFDDGRWLTVSVQGWGAVLLFNPEELEAYPYLAKPYVDPLGEAFTSEYFEGLFTAVAPDDSRSVKYFIISQPQIHGVGNGYLQDILFRAKIHPRRRAVQVTLPEQHNLYAAIQLTLKTAAELNGRDSESDLYGQPGLYVPILDKRAKDRPCPVCQTPIIKESYLGGSVYYCPTCQV